MQRFPRTATNIIAAVTMAAWIIAVVLGQSERAAYALGLLFAGTLKRLLSPLGLGPHHLLRTAGPTTTLPA